MDFGIFAIAFNIGKLYNKIKNTSKNQKKLLSEHQNIFVVVLMLLVIPKKGSIHKVYSQKTKIAA